MAANKMKRDSAFYRQIGSVGGKSGGAARAAALTPERRQEIARKAAQARYSKGKGEQVLDSQVPDL